jgi:hypothetical protein
MQLRAPHLGDGAGGCWRVVHGQFQCAVTDPNYAPESSIEGVSFSYKISQFFG